MNTNIHLYQGDCLEVMKSFPDNSVEAVVTDPPYGLSFMGKKWDYDVPSVEIWKEVLRVLKPGGHLLSFGGTRTYHRMAVNIEDAGFEIRDQIQWLYGSGFPKSLNVAKAGAGEAWEGWGTALKPANEPIVLARKPLEKGLTVAENVLKWGTGGLNIGASRISTNSDEMTDQGRFPANLILDETAAEMLDAQTGIRGGGKFSKSGGRPNLNGPSNSMNAFNQAVKNAPDNYGDTGGASRFFYVAKASQRERNSGLEDAPDAIVDDGRNTPIANPSLRGEAERKNNHPTVKPVKLIGKTLVGLLGPRRELNRQGDRVFIRGAQWILRK